MRDLSMHLLDIIQNSITARAQNIVVKIITDSVNDSLELVITDDGTGMDKELVMKVTNPFTTTRTTRKVGLGIPLFAASAEIAGGELEIHSEKGEGTTLKASFEISHIDRLPLGDIAKTISNTVMSNPEVNISAEFTSINGCFRFSTLEVKSALGEVPINQLDVITWIEEFIDEGIKTIFGGVLNEIIS